MKRLLAAAGFVLLLASPASASAQEAISDAVDEVLARSRAATEAAKETTLEQIAIDSLPEWLRDVLSTALVRIATRKSVVEQERSLAERTTCLRYDLWLLEREADRILEELEEAEGEGNLRRIMLNQEAFAWVNDQHDELLEGGVNPERENKTWATPLLSELPDEEPADGEEPLLPPAAEEEDDAKGKEDETAPFCFFHSDYMPPAPAGYGCGADELEEVLAELPPEKSDFREAVTRERNAMLETERITRSVLASREEFARLQRSIDSLVDGDEPEDDADEEEGAAEDVEPEPIQGCVEAIDEEMILRELGGPFTTGVDEWRLLRDFWKLRRNEGGNRPLPKDLALSKKADLFGDLDTEEQRSELQSFVVTQAEREAATFAAAADPGLALDEAFEGLRDATLLLSRLGSTENGLPAFARAFAYWLRRSCIDRVACDERLETIMKITFTPSCFPYASGEYESATCERPQWKTCLYDALYPDEEMQEEEGCDADGEEPGL